MGSSWHQRRARSGPAKILGGCPCQSLRLSTRGKVYQLRVGNLLSLSEIDDSPNPLDANRVFRKAVALGAFDYLSQRRRPGELGNHRLRSDADFGGGYSQGSVLYVEPEHLGRKNDL